MKKLMAALAIGGALTLAGCSTVEDAPAPVAVAKPVPAGEPIPYRWTHGHSEKGHKAMVETFRRAWFKPGDYAWATEVPKEGDTKVVIDLVSQMAYVYRGETLIGASSISSGRGGASGGRKATPLGFWPVLEKKKFHRSRQYNNAPMPFMQRLDKFGIALHGGLNPGYPASNGCVRLPMKFAELLYGVTKVGTEVIIEG